MSKNPSIYLDNASTTALDTRVKEAIIAAMDEIGNPSSSHNYGRKARALVEENRRTIAHYLHVSPDEITFTSGGTEAANTAIQGAIENLGVKHIITTHTEHHAILHTAQYHYVKQHIEGLHIVEIDEQGLYNPDHLQQLMHTYPKALVGIMHANNEIATKVNLEILSQQCKAANTYLLCDTVQTMGYYPFDFQATNLAFATCSAHKFHGPKGVGFLYTNPDNMITPSMHGGSQERNRRGGTENIYGIVGMGKAIEIAVQEMEENKKHILGIKNYTIHKLKEAFQNNIIFNGDISENSLYRVLNMSFMPFYGQEMLLENLDIQGIAASGGSACSSGTSIGSHVIAALPQTKVNTPALRLSFSKYTTIQEIDTTIEVLKKCCKFNTINELDTNK